MLQSLGYLSSYIATFISISWLQKTQQTGLYRFKAAQYPSGQHWQSCTGHENVFLLTNIFWVGKESGCGQKRCITFQCCSLMTHWTPLIVYTLLTVLGAIETLTLALLQVVLATEMERAGESGVIRPNFTYFQFNS